MAILLCVPFIGLLPVIIVLIKSTIILRGQKDMALSTEPHAWAGVLPAQEIRELVSCQKKLIFSLFAYIFLPFLQLISPPLLVLAVLIQIAEIAAWIASIIFTFKLARRVYKDNLGIIMGILTLIPIVNLFPILKVSNNASLLLRREGIEIGFLGAKLPPQQNA